MTAARRMLLHICCAPDATVPVLDLRAEGWEVVGFFYGSNIQPDEEYRRRVGALRGLQGRTGLSVEEAPYDPGKWLDRMARAGRENGLNLLDEPEGGRRCTVCFTLQLEAAARAASRLGCSHLCTSLTISPHKDVERIARIGTEAAAGLGLTWEPRVWRKRDGFLRSIRLSGDWGLYRQDYCGCLPSRRRNNRNINP